MKVKVESAFVSAGVDVRDGDIITFLNEGEERENERFGKVQLVVLVRLPSGAEKSLSLNNSSKRAMIEVYGDDTSAWVLKEARVNIVKQLVQGKTKSVIILSHPNKDSEGNLIHA